MSEQEIIQVTKKILSKLNEEKYQKKFRRWNKTISFTFNDLGKTWHAIITEGQPGDLVEGTPEKADIKIKTDSETWKGISDGTISAMKALSSKKLSVDGKMMDLIKLQRVMKK